MFLFFQYFSKIPNPFGNDSAAGTTSESPKDEDEKRDPAKNGEDEEDQEDGVLDKVRNQRVCVFVVLEQKTWSQLLRWPGRC